jgi:hypothetical protein
MLSSARSRFLVTLNSIFGAAVFSSAGLLTGALGAMKKEDRAMLELMQKCVDDVRAVKV